MLSIEDLINQIKSYNPNANFDLIKKSYNYGFNVIVTSNLHYL